MLLVSQSDYRSCESVGDFIFDTLIPSPIVDIDKTHFQVITVVSVPVIFFLLWIR